jgi:hypothetical protein
MLVGDLMYTCKEMFVMHYMGKYEFAFGVNVNVIRVYGKSGMDH